MAKCKAKRKDGDGCRAYALKGRDFCLSHDVEIREKVRFGGSQPNAGRPRKPTPSEIARNLVESNVVAVLRPYWRTLGFDVDIGEDGPVLTAIEGGGAKLYGTQQKTGEIKVSPHDDLGAHMQAAERMLDRIYGKPRQAVEMTGQNGGPIQTYDLSKLSPEQLKAMRDTLAAASVGTSES